MNAISYRIKIEWSHLQALGVGLRRLLTAYTIFLVASPMLGLFVNTFLWRQSGGVLLIALYDLGWVFGLPVGFLINGLLLRKIQIKYLYAIGVVLQAIGSALAIFSGVLAPLPVLIYGLLYGVASGFFWGNQNTLELHLSRGRDRNFYNHFYYVIDLLISVVMPVVIGWLIVVGENLGLYQAESAYKVLMVIALILLTTSGILVASFPMPTIKVKKLRLKKPSKNWQYVRLHHFLFNLMWGVNFFLPAFLILYFGSKEGILGTMKSLASILAAGAMYLLGRKAKLKHTVRVVALANVLYLIGCLVLIWQFSWLGAAIYLITVLISSPIRFSTSYTVIMEIMDAEDGVLDGETDYAVVFDNELFFNLGRAVSILFFLAVMTISLEGALKWVPLIMAFMQFLALIPLNHLTKQV
ncbi:MAG: MFS transporter, partial [Candidatus Paceibacterota bacterium]